MGGRGLSAARVTSRDAANLLISICGAPIAGASVKETLSTCKRYAPLRAYRSNGDLGSFSAVSSQLPTLGKLAAGHSFADALSALIDSLAMGDFDFAGRRTGRVIVSFDGPKPEGAIYIQVRRSTRLWYREKANTVYPTTDLRQDRMFTIETLSKIAELIGKGPLAREGREASKKRRSSARKANDVL